MTAIFEVVGGMERALDFHMERQNLIAGNIANVDTPGYAPREIHRPDGSEFRRRITESSLMVTDDRHIGVQPDSDGGEWDVTQERNAIAGNDRNFVSMEHEMARLSANTVRYQAVSKALTAHLGMLRYSAADARG